MAVGLTTRGFADQLGPFALVRRPPDPVMQQVAMRLAAGRTGEHRMAPVPIETALAFDELVILTLPPIGERAVFTVGRLPDMDIVVDHPSVSKRHAELSWDEGIRRCSVKDLGSRNGTMLNDAFLEARDYVVSDNDTLSFGDERFWFLISATLHDRLRSPDHRGRKL